MHLGWYISIIHAKVGHCDPYIMLHWLVKCYVRVHISGPISGRMLVNLYVDASWVVHQYSCDPYFMVHWLWLSFTCKFIFVPAMVLDVLNFICRLQENIEPVVLYKELSLDAICNAVDTGYMQESCHWKNHSKGFPKCSCAKKGVKMTGKPELSYIREYLGEQGLIYQLTLNLKIYLTF